MAPLERFVGAGELRSREKAQPDVAVTGTCSSTKKTREGTKNSLLSGVLFAIGTGPATMGMPRAALARFGPQPRQKKGLIANLGVSQSLDGLKDIIRHTELVNKLRGSKSDGFTVVCRPVVSCKPQQSTGRWKGGLEVSFNARVIPLE